MHVGYNSLPQYKFAQASPLSSSYTLRDPLSVPANAAFFIIIVNYFPVKSPAELGFSARMGGAILSELATEIVVPVCAAVGIVFSLVQWLLVSRVKLTPHGATSSSPSGSNNNKNGYGDYLIEEEEGINDHSVVVKCADIQSAISEGEI